MSSRNIDVKWKLAFTLHQTLTQSCLCRTIPYVGTCWCVRHSLHEITSYDDSKWIPMLFLANLWCNLMLYQTDLYLNALSYVHTFFMAFVECLYQHRKQFDNRSWDDVIKWKHLPRYWPFVQGIHRSPVNFPHKCQWRGALMFSLNCVWINGWVNNREAGDLRRYRTHYDVTVMCCWVIFYEDKQMLWRVIFKQGISW